jgi:hypothetical protein
MSRKQELLDQGVFWRDLCPSMFPKMCFANAPKKRDEAWGLAVE